MHNFCFTISLFHASTCFEHHVLIIRRSKLHYTASGIRMQYEALVPQPAYGYHTATTKPQRNTNTHRTRAIQPMK